ncbi:FAD/NAD(P)-binding protein [Alkalicoccus daliensis]|uniref:L-lysine 6-monooxygenase (NADPH-requiring) n=1 Tax=Alkalicoccus daliensis TaxID=745820 RepID=A0A1G9Z8S1_9BACI|nr:FAD/NAD(P)-binding protein [Alkalicoccus daliensis]SDN17958.1 L-lysine 6-monooxygenase (NADPH-requiring) [Alkalicoccus daliensis]
MYEWVIIGGGIHGCTTANFLVEKGAAVDRMKIIDPHAAPLTRWKKRTSYIGMEFLRSPSVHHIDRDPFSLQKHADRIEDTRNFYGKYKRPNLEMFNEHAEQTFQKKGLMEAWVQGTVQTLQRENSRWRIATKEGLSFEAKNVVVAIRPNNRLHIPSWAEKFRGEGIYHIYEEEAPLMESLAPAVTVIGGGISAAHTVIKLAQLYPGKVTLLKRHPFRLHSFDSDPGWLGPKNLTAFQQTKSYEARREQITNARHRGSLPKDIYMKLKRLEKQQLIEIIDGEVAQVEKKNKQLQVRLKSEETFVTAAMLLATGFQSSLEDEKWLHALRENENLPCAKCGYPIVSSSLEWCGHLYVTGPLSELEIGPVAGNISGAQKAAERIAASVI